MKLQFTLLAGAAALALCSTAFASPEDVIEQNKCRKCHTATTTKKAPSWASLAEKYKSNADAPNKLFKELKAGGKVGDEDDHVAIKASDADIKAIVQIVLSSK